MNIEQLKREAVLTGLRQAIFSKQNEAKLHITECSYEGFANFPLKIHNAQRCLDEIVELRVEVVRIEKEQQSE